MDRLDWAGNVVFYWVVELSWPTEFTLLHVVDPCRHLLFASDGVWYLMENRTRKMQRKGMFFLLRFLSF